MTAETLPAVVHREDSLVERQEYAKALAVSNLLPAQYLNKPGNVLYAIEFGRSLGISTMAAILGVHIIEGRACASAGLISALVRDADHRLRVWVERDANTGKLEKAVATIVRHDDPDFVFRSEWTWARAQAAGVTGKKVWQNYPEAMLKARAVTEVAREACEEALRGVGYTPEELGAEVNEDGSVVITDAKKPHGQSLSQVLGVEQVADEGQQPDGASAPGMATRTQRNAIGAAMIAQGFTKETAPAYLTKVVGHPVTSTEDLTSAEAAQVQHALNRDAQTSMAEPAADEDEVAEAELVDEPDQSDQSDEADAIVMIGKSQSAELHALLKECGITSATGRGSTAINDEKRYAFFSEFVKRDITSASQLTSDDANNMITALKELRVELAADRTHKLGQIGALFDGLGITTMDDRLRDTSSLLGRTITNPNDLADADITNLFDALTAANGDLDKWNKALDSIEAQRNGHSA